SFYVCQHPLQSHARSHDVYSICSPRFATQNKHRQQPLLVHYINESFHANVLVEHFFPPHFQTVECAPFFHIMSTILLCFSPHMALCSSLSMSKITPIVV